MNSKDFFGKFSFQDIGCFPSNCQAYLLVKKERQAWEFNPLKEIKRQIKTNTKFKIRFGQY
ncbi:MAG: hypothetical protein DHS20C18_29380 [Saprospiraceae bacterium]|nr:MAG: hypothetical protein DHS20C18_29380 [Saprospiraceae bacterium]